MRVISLLNEKGGTGKSTLATNLASAFARRGRRVILVDADTQGTARDWRNASPSDADLPTVVPLDRPQVLKTALRSLPADVVVIDAPGSAGDMTASVVAVSDVALVVLAPSAGDAWASVSAIKLIENVRALGRDVHAGFLLNRVDARTNMAKFFQAGEWREQYPIDCLAAGVRYRASFVNALGMGVSVFETADKQAQQDVLDVIDELEARKWLQE